MRVSRTRNRVKWTVQVTPQEHKIAAVEKGVGSASVCLSIFSLTLATVQHILSAGWGADIHYSEGLLLSAFNLF